MQQKQDAPAQPAKRGRGRPKAESKHTPCAFTFTIYADHLQGLATVGITAAQAKRIAREAATKAIISMLDKVCGG